MGNDINIYKFRSINLSPAADITLKKLRSLSPRANYSDRRLSAKLVVTFADRRWLVVSVTDPYDRILDFLNRSRYCFFQAAPQLYSRGWMVPVPDSDLWISRREDMGDYINIYKFRSIKLSPAADMTLKKLRGLSPRANCSDRRLSIVLTSLSGPRSRPGPLNL
jgi:hypothetical protein